MFHLHIFLVHAGNGVSTGRKDQGEVDLFSREFESQSRILSLKVTWKAYYSLSKRLIDKV